MSDESQPILKQGICSKLGGQWKNWKQRWFVLKGSTLYYYAKPDCKVLKGLIQLNSVNEVAIYPECKKPHAFRLTMSNRQYEISCSSDEEANSWVSTISQVIKSLNNSPGATSRSDSPDDLVSLSDFHQIGLLGRGAYGRITLCKYKDSDKLYALKSLSKQFLQENDLIERTKRERDTLMTINHPFLVGAEYSFQTDTHIFMALQYVPGGDMFSLLARGELIEENQSRNYIAMLILAIGDLHANGIIHRDLKPENIMIDADGYLKITDFGLVHYDKNDQSTGTTFCGSPEYMAPEIVTQKPYGRQVDWWALGVIGFRMLFGSSPFWSPNDTIIYNNILNRDPDFPFNSDVSADGEDFICRLLNKDPQQRLGCGQSDFKELQEHPWFEGFAWDDLLNKKLKMQYIPDIKSQTDISNFDFAYTAQSTSLTYVDPTAIDAETQNQLSNFTLQNTSPFEE